MTSNKQILSGLALGKDTHYQHLYNPKLLQVVPRSMNREPLGLYPDSLPFHGEDIWTLYELSWLTPRGLPQVAIADVRVPANTPNLIESKSFKLYLNSFNQSHFKNFQAVQETLQSDLSLCAQGDVTVYLHDLNHFSGQPIQTLSGVCIDNQDIEINDYNFNPLFLSNCINKEIVTESLVSHLLKSNCLITHQPDWGSIQISYCGPKINRTALLRYLVSFRQHDEFHEQCVERIFSDLLLYCQPTQLAVYARYTRRGGLDINPYRANYPFTPENYRLARQ